MTDVFSVQTCDVPTFDVYLRTLLPHWTISNSFAFEKKLLDFFFFLLYLLLLNLPYGWCGFPGIVLFFPK